MVVPAGNALADVLLHPLALLGVLEAFEHLGGAAFVGPGRNDAGQVVVAARVGIDVGLHVDAALAGVVDQRHDLVHAAPELLVGDLDVDDVHRDAGPLADGDRLLDRPSKTLGPLVADVRREDAAVLGHDLAQLDDVVGGGQRAGRHGQQLDRPKAPSFIASSTSAFICSSCSAVGRAYELPMTPSPDVVQADVGGDVDGDAGLLQRVEVAAERGPAAPPCRATVARCGVSLPWYGPAELPSPSTSVVTPWRILLWASPSSSRT